MRNKKFFIITLGAILVCACSAWASPMQHFTDARITAKIKARFMTQKGLDPFNIHVTTYHGVVRLTGGVHDPRQKEMAEKTAQSVGGVRRIINEIIVLPDSSMEKEQKRTLKQGAKDKWLETSIRSRLLYHKQLGGLNLGIHAHNGIVTVRGTVASKEQKKIIEQIIRDTRGVKSIKDNITLLPQNAQNPSATIGQDISDELIEKHVESALLMNWRIKVRQLNVKVKNHVCVLHGIVPTEKHRELAGQIAASVSGVHEVHNELEVKAETSSGPVQNKGDKEESQLLSPPSP